MFVCATTKTGACLIWRGSLHTVGDLGMSAVLQSLGLGVPGLELELMEMGESLLFIYIPIRFVGPDMQPEQVTVMLSVSRPTVGDETTISLNPLKDLNLAAY